MLSRPNLELLKDSAVRGDWRGTDDAYLELVLQATETGEAYSLDALTWALRLQNAKRIAAIVDEMLGDSSLHPPLH